MLKDEYCIDLENRKQTVLEYNSIVDLRTKHNDEGIDRWTYEYIEDNQNNPSRGSSNIHVII